jgi:hypothetical protein
MAAVEMRMVDRREVDDMMALEGKASRVRLREVKNNPV